MEIAVGTDAEAHRGLILPLERASWAWRFARAEPVTSADVTQDDRVSAGPPRFAGLGPAVAVPIGTGEAGARGVVLLARPAGRPAFTDGRDRAAAGVRRRRRPLAMELAERRRDAEQVAVLEDRDRIARDLHDLAIQRLFATGMTLQSAGRFIEHPEAAERVVRAVDDLDETIKIIRSTIFGLRSHDGAREAGLRARVVRVASEAAPVLGFAPSLRMEGLLDTDVPKAIADHVVAVLSEALTNVARHAKASRAEVALTTDGRQVRLTVTDDGVGIAAGGRRSGLRNMAERADQEDGRFDLAEPAGGGTTLVWSVPVARV